MSVCIQSWNLEYDFQGVSISNSHAPWSLGCHVARDSSLLHTLPGHFSSLKCGFWSDYTILYGCSLMTHTLELLVVRSKQIIICLLQNESSGKAPGNLLHGFS